MSAWSRRAEMSQLMQALGKQIASVVACLVVTLLASLVMSFVHGEGESGVRFGGLSHASVVKIGSGSRARSVPRNLSASFHEAP